MGTHKDCGCKSNVVGDNVVIQDEPIVLEQRADLIGTVLTHDNPFAPAGTLENLVQKDEQLNKFSKMKKENIVAQGLICIPPTGPEINVGSLAALSTVCTDICTHCRGVSGSSGSDVVLCGPYTSLQVLYKWELITGTWMWINKDIYATGSASTICNEDLTFILRYPNNYTSIRTSYGTGSYMFSSFLYNTSDYLGGMWSSYLISDAVPVTIDISSVIPYKNYEIHEHTHSCFSTVIGIDDATGRPTGFRRKTCGH